MTVIETPEDQVFNITEWRQSLQDDIRNLGKDPFGAIRESGARSLFQYLVMVVLRPAVHAYRVDSANSEQVRLTVQEVAGPFAQPLLDALKARAYQEEMLGSTIDEQLSSSAEFCRAIERVMIETNVLPLVQNVFAAEEWLLRTLRQELQQWHSQGLFQRLVIAIPSEQYEAAPASRGALNLEVSASKPTIVAGEEFSLFVVIRNPYQVPVVVYTVETHIPIELVDMVDIRRRQKELELETTSHLDETRVTGWRRNLLATWYAWRNQRRVERETGARIAEAVGTEYKPELVVPEPSISLDVAQEIKNVAEGAVVTGVEIGRIEHLSQFLLDFPEPPSPEYLDRIMWRIEAYKSGKIPVLLQPGDSVVRQFVFRTRAWLLFTPLAHSFQIQVRYLLDGRDHMDTTRYDSSIQAAITATMIGSILGGALGGVARILVDSATQPVEVNPLAQVGSLMLAVILSAVSVVSLARKSNVQQIVSIEDFWGGLFLGFLIGYLGQNFALGMLSPQPPDTP